MPNRSCLLCLSCPQGNRKLKVEELHSGLLCPVNTRIANPRPFYYSDLAIALVVPSSFTDRRSQGELFEKQGLE
jgi:hypothetical protein